jgi:hypothetical protein
MKVTGSMKKLLFLVVCFVLVAPMAHAAPFLISDPMPLSDAVTSFQLFFDGGAAIVSPPDATRAIRYDLVGLSNGNHTVVARACNEWGCSVDSVPLVFVKGVPVAPVRLRLVP